MFPQSCQNAVTSQYNEDITELEITGVNTIIKMH